MSETPIYDNLVRWMVKATIDPMSGMPCLELGMRIMARHPEWAAAYLKEVDAHVTSKGSESADAVVTALPIEALS